MFDSFEIAQRFSEGILWAEQTSDFFQLAEQAYIEGSCMTIPDQICIILKFSRKYDRERASL